MLRNKEDKLRNKEDKLRNIEDKLRSELREMIEDKRRDTKMHQYQCE